MSNHHSGGWFTDVYSATVILFALGAVVVFGGLLSAINSPLPDHGATWWSDTLIVVAAHNTDNTGVHLVARLINGISSILFWLWPFSGLVWMLSAGLFAVLLFYARRLGAGFDDKIKFARGITAVLSFMASLGVLAGTPPFADWPGIVVGMGIIIALGLSALNLHFAMITIVRDRPFSAAARLFRGKSIIRVGVPDVERCGGGVLIGTTDDKLLPVIVRQFAAAGVDKLLPAQEIRLPFDDLANGIAVVGAKNSGKSRLLFQIVEQIRGRWPDILTVVVDKKGGEFCSRYYDADRDLILSPHDKRSAFWDVLADFRRAPQLISVAASAALGARMETTGDAAFWYHSAMRTMTSILKRLASSNVVSGALDKIAAMLKAVKESADETKNKTAQSKYETLVEGVGDFIRWALPPAARPAPLGVDDLLARKGFLFLLDPFDATKEQSGSVGVLLSCLLRRALSKTDTDAMSPRVLFLIDEVNTVKLDYDLEVALYSTARSKGIIMLTATQLIPDDKPEKKVQWWAQSDYRIIMRLNDHGSQKRASESVGKLLYDETMKSRSADGVADRIRTTTQEQERYHDAIETNYWQGLAPREFLLIARAISAGRSVDVPTMIAPAGENCGQMQYDMRMDVVDWVDGLENTINAIPLDLPTDDADDTADDTADENGDSK